MGTPRVPVEELLRLAREVIARTGKILPRASEELPLAEKALSAPPEPEGPVLDAAKAMERVINKTIGRFNPSTVLDPKTAPRLSRVPDWLEGKAGLDLPIARPITEEDLRSQAASYLLRDVERAPNKSLEQLVSGIEPSLARWVEERSSLFSGEPRVVKARRRLLQKAGTYWGRRLDDPVVLKARQDLEKEGLLLRPRRDPEIEDFLLGQSGEEGALQSQTQDLRRRLARLVPSPEEVYLSQIETPASADPVLTRLSQLLADPKVLTEKQRAALSLLYGEDEMSMTAIAKYLKIDYRALRERKEGALTKLKKILTKEKMVPDFLAERHPSLVQGPAIPLPGQVIRPGGESYVRIPENQEVLPRMGSEFVETPSGTIKVPSILQDIFGRRVPKGKPELKISERTQVTHPSFVPPAGLRPEEERKALLERLKAVVRNPQTGEPLFPARTEQVTTVKKSYAPGEPLPSAELPPKPLKPPLRRLPKAEEIQKMKAEDVKRLSEEEFSSTNPSKLIPDPNGDVQITVGGVEMRFRRVRVKQKDVIDPKTKKRKTVLVEE